MQLCQTLLGSSSNYDIQTDCSGWLGSRCLNVDYLSGSYVPVTVNHGVMPCV